MKHISKLITAALLMSFNIFGMDVKKSEQAFKNICLNETTKQEIDTVQKKYRIDEIFDFINDWFKSGASINRLDDAYKAQMVNTILYRNVFVYYLRSKKILMLKDNLMLIPQRELLLDEKDELITEFLHLIKLYKALMSNDKSEKILNDPFTKFLIRDQVIKENGLQTDYEQYFWIFCHYLIRSNIIDYSKSYQDIKNRLQNGHFSEQDKIFSESNRSYKYFTFLVGKNVFIPIRIGSEVYYYPEKDLSEDEEVKLFFEYTGRKYE